ncbi:MAG TPA: TonB-dependent receptor, partial [Bryobacteraceae bacterium]|nr:TonB-dependent receptor [Bryobacteraceae bacterium]
ITQRVEVQAEAASVQTDDNTLSTVIDAAKIRELPLPANRNLFRLALLAPGMSRGPASSVTTSTYGPGFGIASMGQKVHNNAVLLDGAPLKTSMHGVIRMRPSVEAIEEFRVESGWYSAEYGTQSGAQIIAAMKPGTNQFHGVLFEFLRNDKLDARNFFNTGNKAPLRRNTFGGVLSGPIIKNKTFFTFNGEFLRERRSSQAYAIYPSEKMRAGDLTESYFRRSNGSLIPIMDLSSGLPFPNNQIPASRIAPQAQGFFKFWPLPNYGPSQFNGTNNYTGIQRDLTNDDQEFVRIDHNFSSKDKLFGRYGIETVNLPTYPINPNPYFITRRPRRQQNATATYTRLVSATMLNEFRVSYNRDVYQTYDDVSGSSFNILNELHIPGQTSNPTDTGLPSLSITGVSGLGNTDINTIWDESRQVLDYFSINKGAHTIKFGGEYTRLRLDRRTVNFVKGAFNFTGIHSSTAPGVAGSESGRLAWADFLLDEPSQVRLGYSTHLPPGANPGLTYPRTRFWRAHGFIQDDWKALPNLTVNLGLRYEYNSAIVDTSGQSRNIDWSTLQLFPDPGKPGPLNDPSQRQFAPRIGLAWRPFGGTNTVIRSGFGIFYNVNMINMWVPALATAPPNNININELNPAGQLLIRMATADQAEVSSSSELNVADTQRGVGSVE